MPSIPPSQKVKEQNKVESVNDAAAIESSTVVTLPSLHHQAQELSGLDQSVIEVIKTTETGAQITQSAQTKESYASLSNLRINVPEVRDASSEFVYNYFTADERVKDDPSNKVLDITKSRKEELFYQIKNDNVPRFIKLSFTRPKRHGLKRSRIPRSTVMNSLDKIVIEGASTNQFYTGFELIDTGKEKELYKRLRGGMFITDVADPKDSPIDSLNRFLEKLNETTPEGEKKGLTGQDKKMMKEALRFIQPSSGFAGRLTSAPSDVPADIAAFANDPIQKQNFSMQFDNLILRGVTESAIRIPDTVFQDEFASLIDIANEKETQSIQRHDPNSVGETYNTFSCRPIRVRPFQKIKSAKLVSKKKQKMAALITPSAYNTFPKIKIAGYLIQKWETLETGELVEHGMLYNANPDSLFIIDKNVRYGGSYTYKIRTLYEVEMFAETRYAGDPSLSTNSICTILLASEGKTTSAYCSENIPPPPPANLRVRFNFREKKPFLTWQFPLNPQRDIKRFQIFKRLNIKQPFTLIAEYDFDDSVIRSNVPEVAIPENVQQFSHPRVSFLDEDFELGTTPIYTIASVDAHGMSSNYGVQMRISYDERRNKAKTQIMSSPGAPKPYPNLLINVDAFDDAIKVSNYDRMRIYFDPEYYKVYKDHDLRGIGKVEKDLNFLRIDPDKDTYKIHMINLDLQKDKILNIRIADKSGSPIEAISAARFGKNHINFDFGAD